MSLSMNSSSNKNKRRRKENRSKQQQHFVNYYDTIDTTEEQMLTAALFGTSTTSTTSALQNTADKHQHQKEKETPQEKQQAFTFEIDRVGDSSNVGTMQEVDQTNDHPKDSRKIVANIREDKEIGITSAKDHKPSTDTTDAAAWVDDDDEQVQISLIEQSDRIRKLRNERSEIGSIDGVNYQKRLRQRYMNTTQLTSNTSWANITENTNDTTKIKGNDTTEESISTSYIESNTSSSNKIPPPNQIRMKRCPDANIQDPNQSVTQVVQFHPSSSGNNATSNNGNNNNINDENPLLLTAGFDKTLRFFKCNEEASTKVHGVHFPNFPIYSTSFIGSSNTVVVTGRRPFFYLYDTVADQVQRIPKLHGREEKSWERCIASPYDDRTIALLGNDGYIILYDTKRLQCRTSQPIKLNGSVRTVAFANEGNELIASGSDGDIYRFDIRSSMSKCMERFNNLDGTITSYIASSRRTFAVGAESGVVNIYAERQQQLSVAPASYSMSTHSPLKSIMNIKTSIDMIRYNHDGNILAISSRREKDCMKLVHIPTRTVYSNWPTSQTPLGYVWSIDFSPQSKFIAIGNDHGKCLLYKLMHYE